MGATGRELSAQDEDAPNRGDDADHEKGAKLQPAFAQVVHHRREELEQDDDEERIVEGADELRGDVAGEVNPGGDRANQLPEGLGTHDDEHEANEGVGDRLGNSQRSGEPGGLLRSGHWLPMLPGAHG